MVHQGRKVNEVIVVIPVMGERKEWVELQGPQVHQVPKDLVVREGKEVNPVLEGKMVHLVYLVMTQNLEEWV